MKGIDGYYYATDDKTYIYHMVRNPKKQSKGLVYPEGVDPNTTGNPRSITSEEAIAIMEAERERGHIQNAFFKDAMGDRLYCICNCCSCCCNAIKAQNYTTIPTLIPSGYVRDVNNDKCLGCGTCVEGCNFFALSLVDGKAVVDQTKCRGCVLCESKCPNWRNHS